MFETGSWFWRWLAEQAPFIEVGIGMFFVLVLAPATLVGSESSVVDVLEQRRERWQMSYIVVPIESTETLAPVVARLAGR